MTAMELIVKDLETELSGIISKFKTDLGLSAAIAIVGRDREYYAQLVRPNAFYPRARIAFGASAANDPDNRLG